MLEFWAENLVIKIRVQRTNANEKNREKSKAILWQGHEVQAKGRPLVLFEDNLPLRRDSWPSRKTTTSRLEKLVEKTN